MKSCLVTHPSCIAVPTHSRGFPQWQMLPAERQDAHRPSPSRHRSLRLISSPRSELSPRGVRAGQGLVAKPGSWQTPGRALQNVPRSRNRRLSSAREDAPGAGSQSPFRCGTSLARRGGTSLGEIHGWPHTLPNGRISQAWKGSRDHTDLPVLPGSGFSHIKYRPVSQPLLEKAAGIRKGRLGL